MPPLNHSLLGASSSARWLACTPSARLTEEMEENKSVFAEEGTAAHELCEWKVRKALKKRAGKRPVSDYWTDEMEECADSYREFIMDIVADIRKQCEDPLTLVEQHVDYSDYVPGGYGTCDFLAASDHILHVVDFKYGKGVPVPADHNPQMMLYALGSYLAFSCLYDFKTVRMTIYQPRLFNVSTFEMKTSELLDWAEHTVKPRAESAFKGEGDFIPGEHCRFCKAKDTCRARTEEFLKLAQMEFKPAPLLTDAEIAEVMGQATELSKWASDLVAYAQAEAIEHGKHYDGYKLVEGRSNRKFTSEEDVIKASSDAGYTDIYEKKLISLTGFEKLMGKKEFEEILGRYVIKPKGKLTLVPVSDKRPEVTVNQAEQDFKE